MITRKAARRPWYDEGDRVTVEIKDEQEQECVREVRIYDNKDGIYNISYFPRVQRTIKLLIKVNGKHIHGSPFAVIVKPFQVKPVLCVGKEGSGEGLLNNPLGVAVTAKDEVVVADNQNHRVQVFDSNGTFLRSFGRQGKNAGEFENPTGIAIDKDGNILVSEYHNHRVQGRVPERPISANPGLKFCSILVFYIPMHSLW